MRNIIFAATLGLLGIGSAHAGEQPTYEVGYSTFASVGVKCTTGTVVQINADRPTSFAANVAGYRIQNQNGTYAAWLGGISVATSTAVGDFSNLGEKLTPGADAVWHLNKDYKRAGLRIPLYCKAEDSAGANGVVLSLVWFGY